MENRQNDVPAPAGVVLKHQLQIRSGAMDSTFPRVRRYIGTYCNGMCHIAGGQAHIFFIADFGRAFQRNGKRQHNLAVHCARLHVERQTFLAMPYFKKAAVGQNTLRLAKYDFTEIKILFVNRKFRESPSVVAQQKTALRHL